MAYVPSLSPVSSARESRGLESIIFWIALFISITRMEILDLLHRVCLTAATAIDEAVFVLKID